MCYNKYIGEKYICITMKGRNIMETIKGLTHEEVEEKIKQGKSNKSKNKKQTKVF